ncbi:polysaccharide pyruvyl transferase WcaK-like protein [Arthrobacter sp. SLBN-100]|uniref:polysaccharide pyruvyl transferase family protein n=1 Tax=Arthrobacter sp. SLBN-100 TaxID=2768450 RepID=UPI001151BC91|nr:polysaccharide pyruvyl transferase family protein [Arthrobacter sp. SLBN-100]TQJ67189.1 polysaccharide pyruvyl transferase WcaK-like protein [Arthrobacter sp. SLBN-100]
MAENLYLIASGGNPNYGDELIVAAWLRFLARVRPDATVWLDCPQPVTASALFSRIHAGFRATNTLWRACAEAPDQSAQGVWEHVGNVVARGGSHVYDIGLMELGQADSMHLLGGGYVNGVWPDHVGLVAGMKAARKLSGCRLLGSGLGLWPLPRNAEQLANSFADFSAVSVRDDASAKFLGLATGLDDAFLGLLRELRRSAHLPQSRAQDVMLCIQSDMTDERTFSRLRDKLRVVVENSLASGLSVGYVEAIPGSDRIMFDALEGLIPEENFASFTQIWRLGLPVRPGQHWYTSRFHPHLVAAAAGASGVAIGILDDYYDVKHRSLLDLGTGWVYASAEDQADLPLPTKAPSFENRSLRLANQKRREALALYPVP